MRFDLTDLRLFVNIVESGTITGGAAQTHMTLASASQRVIGMEESLGTPLLLRAKQGVKPTEAGRTLVHHARLVLLQMERMRGELSEYGTGLKGHVRLLCNTSAMTEHLPEALSGFLARNPRVSVDLEEQPSTDIVDAVRAVRAHSDIGVVSDAVDVEGLQHFVFRRDDLVLVVPRGHRLARRRRLTLAELADCEFVGLAEGSPLEAHIALHARRLGKRLVVSVRARSFGVPHGRAGRRRRYRAEGRGGPLCCADEDKPDRDHRRMGGATSARMRSPRGRTTVECTEDAGPLAGGCASLTLRDGRRLEKPNIGNPVSLPARQSRLEALSVERGGRAAKKGGVNVVERIHVHDGEDVVFDRAGHQGHDAATGTDMKLGRARSEEVPGDERPVGNGHAECAVGVRRPDAAVPGAERATARTRRNFGRVRVL